MEADELLRDGIELQQQGRLLEAARRYSAVLQDDPRCAQAWHLLGTIEIERGNLEAALTLIHRALEIGPESAAFHNNLAYVHGARGEMERATAHYRQAIALAPHYAEAYHNLASATRFEPGDPVLRSVLEQLARPGRSARDRCFLHFAAGKIHDDLGEHDTAFAHYRQANEAHAATSHPAYSSDYLEEIRETFQAEFLKRRCAHGSDSELPVFVVGMPRSGTSLVEQILASHPQVHGAGELPYLDAIARELPRQLIEPVPYPACMPDIAPDRLQEIGHGYLERLRELAPGARRVVSKTPLDFRHLGLVALLFPRARILHVRRSPLDTCVSCYFQNFAHGQEYSFDLRELGRFYRDYDRLMSHWRAALPLPMLELRYEDLVHDPEPVTREMLAFCGLDWNERCADFHHTRREVRTASRWQVRQPLYESSVGRWRHYADHLGELREALGPLGEEHAQTPARDRSSRTASQVRSAPSRPAPIQGDVAPEFAAASAAHREGRLADAEAGYRRVLDLAPDHAEALHHLGILAYQGAQPETGLELLRRSVRLDPGNAFFQRNLAHGLLRSNHYAEAVAAARRSLELEPRRLDAHGTLCDALVQLGRGREAEEVAQRALALEPGSALAHAALGSALLAQGELAAAEQALCDSLAIHEVAETRNRLGLSLHKQGRLAEAEAAYRRALEGRPRYAEAHFNLASVLLLTGRYEEGFREYEWRWYNEQWAGARRELPAPLWDGAPLSGRRILLHAEQGLGDAIQFVRFAESVAERGGDVLLECPESLCALFESAAGVGQVIPRGAELPAFDVHAPLMSLPRILGTQLGSLPAPERYLRADSRRVRRWRMRMGRHRRPRIGLVWAGNPAFADDALRSPGLAAYRPLVESESIQRCELYALQKGEPRQQLLESDLREKIVDLGEELDDFAETAAAMACMDVIVSSCTAPAHLAGALGVPGLVLLPRLPDWRWLLEREDSPWYPSLRLLRQGPLASPAQVQADGNEWAAAVDAALQLLQKLRKVRKKRA